MEAKVHVPIGFISCLIVYIITYYWYWNGNTFSLAFFGIFGSLLPDLDQIFKRHRDWFTHSSIIPIISVVYMLGWSFGRYYDVFYLSLAIGLHLLFDLKFDNKKKLGTYCIVKPGYVLRKKKKSNKKELGMDRMTAKHTDLWLIGNMLLCFALCFLLYVIF